MIKILGGGDKNLRFPLLSILEAVLTLSPNKQYLGIDNPTTPATTPPVWMPIRRLMRSPEKSIILIIFDGQNRQGSLARILTE